MKQLAPLLLPEARAFSLDFHPIPYRGDEAVLGEPLHPVPGKATPSVQTFFAQEHENRVLCYANANLTRAEQPGEVLRFVEFWHALTGHDPEWLYFDSKLTTYAELSRLNQRGVYFATIRRRGPRLLQRLKQRPASDWTGAVIDIPKRRQKQIRYLEEPLRFRTIEGAARQIAVTGLGREEPTLFLTNHFEVRPRQLIINYARRNGIEDGLGTNVNFFHLDCLSSEVRLNVDLDVTLTVIANGCYRWLARQLKGFEQAKPEATVPEVHRDRRPGRSRCRSDGCSSPSTAAATIRSCAKPPWIATARRSRGSRTTASSSPTATPLRPRTSKMSVDFPPRKSAASKPRRSPVPVQEGDALAGRDHVQRHLQARRPQEAPQEQLAPGWPSGLQAAPGGTPPSPPSGRRGNR